MGFNYDNPDYDNYVVRFELAEYPTTDNILSILDFGYDCFQAFFKDVGITDYNHFRRVQALLVFIVLGIFTYKNCYYKNVFLYIYIFCFLILDTVQIRNLVAFIVLIPFIPLLRRKDKKACLLYTLGLVLSISFHFSMVFFSIFIIMFVKSRRNKIIAVFLLAILFAFSATIISQLPAFDRVSDYSRSSVLGAAFMASHCVISTYIIDKIFYPATLNIAGTQVMNLPPSLMRAFNTLFLIIIPFFLINASINRIFRYVGLVNIMFMLNVIYYARGHIRRKLTIWLLLYATYFGIYYVYMKPEVYESVLSYNNFLDCLF